MRTLDVTRREVAALQLNLRFDKQKKVWEFVSFGIQPQAEEKYPVLLAVQFFIREEREWQGYAGELLEKLKAKGRVEAEPQTLPRLMNAHITELADQYGVLYKSGKRTEKGRCVYLKDIHETSTGAGDQDRESGEDSENFRMEDLSQTEPDSKTVHALNDHAEIMIGGATYRIRSVFADKGKMDDMLELAILEMMNRIA